MIILRQPEEVMHMDKVVLRRLYNLAVDETNTAVILNSLCLQHQLIEKNISPDYNQFVVDLSTEFQSALIFTQCVNSEKEHVVLNALYALTTMATIPKFKAIILIDVGDLLFPALT